VIKAVIDTNVLVSALLSPSGPPAKILNMVISKQIMICIDSRIMLEYENVLLRDKFPFEPQDISVLLSTIFQIGNVVVPKPIYQVAFNQLNAKTATVFENASKARIFKNLRRGGNPPRNIQLQSKDCNWILESSFLHQEDKKFYEAAKHCGAYLVTGNLRHFPKEPHAVSPAEFLESAKWSLEP
jgi:putative PIN family toxin of toxin-antitoxin system